MLAAGAAAVIAYHQVGLYAQQNNFIDYRQLRDPVEGRRVCFEILDL